MIDRPSRPEHVRKPVVVLAVNSLWNIINFRMGLIGALQNEGCRIVVVSPAGEGAELLESRGVSVRSIQMSARGTSPLADARLLANFYRILRETRPDALLAFTAKPNIYGSLAARALGIPAINNVAGLGSAFTRKTWLTRLMISLYKLAFHKSEVVFFQNPDDHALFVDRGIVREQQAGLLPGSGVDLDRFRPVEAPVDRAAPFRFLLPARLLWAKGLAEYVEAAQQVLADGGEVRFQMLGFVDPADPASVSPAQLNRWQDQQLIEYLGVATDVRPFLAEADCIVLPSYYREGVPRVLLEAAAMAKPIITTNAIGCREAVDDGQTGLVCMPRSAQSLARAMTRMLQLQPEERRRMGAAGRLKMERQFSQDFVHSAYVRALKCAGIIPERAPAGRSAASAAPVSSR